MKNKPLYFKIWVVTTATISIISIAVAILMYVWSDIYFENQLILQMDMAQSMVAIEARNSTKIEPSIEVKKDEIGNIETGLIDINVDYRNVTQLDTIDGIIIDRIQQQDKEKQYYQEKIDGKSAMYVIEQVQTPIGLYYAYSFAYNPYKEMLNELFIIIAFAIFIFLFISFIVMRVVCKKMTLNISNLQTYADKIAFQEWNESIDIKDFNHSIEVMDLAESFEQMRKKLVQRDENMQSMLQYISHELKTPIMVIRSYIDAAKDGIYPKGSLDSSLDIMESQSLRLQEKVNDLLYITKLENSKLAKDTWNNNNLSELLINVLSNFELVNKDVDIQTNLDESISIKCNIQNIAVLFENMLENIIRHADKKIIITMKENKDKVRILFYNDGEPIPLDVKNKIFKPFEKGQNGNVGLGLSICNKIVEIHSGTIKIPYTKKGCIFIIDLPSVKNKL